MKKAREVTPWRMRQFYGTCRDQKVLSVPLRELPWTHKPHENPAVGILLCATKDEEVVEHALSRSFSPAEQEVSS